MQLQDYVTQTMPDQFYYTLWAFAFITLTFGGRSIHLFMLWWNPSRQTSHTQRKRYTFALISIVVSVGAFVFLLWQYTPSQIYIGINEWFQPFKTFYWLAIVTNAVNLVMSLVFIVRARLVPTHYAKYSRQDRVYLTTQEVRMLRQMHG